MSIFNVGGMTKDIGIGIRKRGRLWDYEELRKRSYKRRQMQARETGEDKIYDYVREEMVITGNISVKRSR